MTPIPIGHAPGVLAPYLDAHASVQEAARIMATSQRDCVLLLQHGHVAGVFSDQELLHAMQPDGTLPTRPASQWLAPGLAVCEEDDCRSVCLALEHQGYRFALVHASDGSLVNITTPDLLRCHLEQQGIDDPAVIGRVLANMDDGLLVMAADNGHLLKANPRACQHLGCRAEALIGTPVWEGPLGIQDADHWQRHLARIRADGRVQQVVSIVRADGERADLEISACLASDAQQDYVVGVVRDISERRSTQDRLRQASIVLQNSREAVLTTDPDGIILDINPAFTAITGYSAKEAIGQSLQMVCAHHPDDSFYDSMWAELRRDGHWQGDTWNRRRDGEPFAERLSIHAARDEQGRLSHYVALFSDISMIQQSRAELEHLAHHDALTHLPNRLLFTARLEHALSKGRRHHSQCAVMFIDLDRFKHINDSLGHPVGDTVLVHVARRLHDQLRGEDTLARMSGDEFTVLLEDTNPRFAASVAGKLLAALDTPFMIDDQELYLSSSIGIALYPNDGDDEESLLRNAEAAMRKAKERGRNTLQFFTQELTSDAFERTFMETHLRRAQHKDEFRIHFQPQVDLVSGQIIGLEALLRWQHPQLGLVMPARFVPLLEDNGLIVPVGEQVLGAACRHARGWFDNGLLDGRVSVNIAGLQITRGDLPGLVARALDNSGLSPARLELEVTETFIMSDPETTIIDLQKVRDMGVKVAIDDFGTGYSSLAYLKRLPIDRLKIDQSFVRDLPGDREDEAITRAIIALGNSLGMEVIAEGVETAETAAFLRAAGCRLGQGYLYGRPMPADQIEDLLASGMQQAPVTDITH